MSVFDVILSGRKAAKDIAWVGRSAVDRLVHFSLVGRQIVPVGIHTLDQLDLLAADPAF